MARKKQRLKGSYKKKYETLIKRKGVKEKVKLVKSIYQLKTFNPKELRSMSKEKRKEYYKLQYRVASGKFETDKRKIFRQNYIKYLDSIGVSDEVINMAKRLLRRRDLETTSRELAPIVSGQTLSTTMKGILPVRFYDLEKQGLSVENIEEDIEALYYNYYGEDE